MLPQTVKLPFRRVSAHDYQSGFCGLCQPADCVRHISVFDEQRGLSANRLQDPVRLFSSLLLQKLAHLESFIRSTEMADRQDMKQRKSRFERRCQLASPPYGSFGVVPEIDGAKNSANCIGRCVAS